MKYAVHSTQYKGFIFLIVFVFFLLAIGYSLFASSTHAQIPPPKVPCTNTDDPEFHSLRPYPFKPCQTTVSDTAKFCGNDLTLQFSAVGEYPGSGVCTTSGGKVTCKFSESVDKDIIIDLSGADLPIMGNTENVPNSTSKTGDAPTLNDADKMNGYVSWYLNGVLNRAEDGSAKTADEKNIVNFSGPINKLLPSAILDAQRIKSINNSKVTNHDQIAVCAQEEFLGIWGKTNPHECYDGNKTDAKPDVYRLEDWNGDLSALRAVLNIINPLDAWNKRTPPLPWNFESEILYQKAYNEWRGRSCAIVPIINKIVCIDNPFIRNKWADLYSYIPLSGTEDLKGSIQIDGVSSTSSESSTGVALSNVGFIGENPSAPLFFPHMQESTDLASILQDTYVASSEKGNKTADPTDVSTNAICSNVEVRSNKGDKLLESPTELTGTLHYEAKYSCEFNPPSCTNATKRSMAGVCENSLLRGSCVPSTSNWSCAVPLGRQDCPSGYVCGRDCSCSEPVQTCTKNFYINLSTSGDIPKADDIWSQLVAGPQAIFKRIFPKTNVPGSVGQIIDIPGSTNITYSGEGISQSNTDLKFPHIGGISEYFLKGIQTMLRPKGYGEPISFGETTTSSSCGGSLPEFPKAGGSCVLGGISSRIGNVPQFLTNIIEAAAQTYKVPPNLILGIMFGEGLFNPGRFDWTDQNVKSWATCERIPGCNETGDDNFTGFNGNDFPNITSKIIGDLQKIDPTKTKETLSQCNLLDAIYAQAWNLHNSADGGMAFSCFGINLNAPIPTSCDWTPNQYESAIKIAETGYAKSCNTYENSCFLGSGAPKCPGGLDNCETINTRYTKPSHNGCIWDVAHGQ